MNSLVKKYFLVFSLSVVPLAFLLCDNFVFHRRGWQTPEVQYNLVFWTIRLLLTPAVICYNLKLWTEFNRPVRSLLVQIFGLVFYLAAHWYISFVILKNTLPAGAVNGNRDLFDRIKEASLATDVLVCISTACFLYLFEYFDRARKSILQPQRQKQSEPISRIAVKTGTKTILLPLEQIICFKADGQYIQVSVKDHNYLIKQPLYQLQNMLPADTFLRIHKSCIINIHYVREVRSLLNGDHTVFLRETGEVRASRTYKQSIQALFGKA